MGLNLTKRTKSDFVDFLWIGTLISGLECSNEMGQYRGLNIIVKNVCYHELNYGLVFLIFLIWLLHFYWHMLYVTFSIYLAQEL